MTYGHKVVPDRNNDVYKYEDDVYYTSSSSAISAVTLADLTVVLIKTHVVYISDLVIWIC